MNKTLISSAIAAVTFCVALSAQAQARQDFSITNGIGDPIVSLYISPNDQNTWGSDVLGRDILANGDGAAIHFDASTNPTQCIWDIRLDTPDGHQWIVQNVNLCTVSAMRFTRQGGAVVYETR